MDYYAYYQYIKEVTYKSNKYIVVSCMRLFVNRIAKLRNFF